MNTIVTTQAINSNFGCLKGYNYRKAGFEAKKDLLTILWVKVNQIYHYWKKLF